MEEILDLGGPIAEWVRQWGYLAIFLGIMMENAGVPVPGETMIVIASVFAAQKVLRVELVYLAVVCGAILGDNIGYWIGYKGGRPLLYRLARLGHVTEAQLEATEAQFRRHSDWAVFFGRFVALLRIFAGPLAGMVHMPWTRFFVFNAGGAIIWAGVVVGVAFKLGEHAHMLLHSLGLTLLALVVLFVAWLVYKVWRANRQAGTMQAGVQDEQSTPVPPGSSDEPHP